MRNIHGDGGYAPPETLVNTLEKIGGNEQKSTLVSRNIVLMGRRTSIRLEPEMWRALHEIAQREGCSLHSICSLISLRKKKSTTLTAAVRVFLMLYFRSAATEEGHKAAGHGNFDFMLGRAGTAPDMIFKNKRKVSEMPAIMRPGAETTYTQDAAPKVINAVS